MSDNMYAEFDIIIYDVEDKDEFRDALEAAIKEAVISLRHKDIEYDSLQYFTKIKMYDEDDFGIEMGRNSYETNR